MSGTSEQKPKQNLLSVVLSVHRLFPVCRSQNLKGSTGLRILFYLAGLRLRGESGLFTVPMFGLSFVEVMFRISSVLSARPLKE